jgi:hypothetical protein
LSLPSCRGDDKHCGDHRRVIGVAVTISAMTIKAMIVPRTRARWRGESFHPYIMSGVAKFWQGEALSNMPIFRIRMAEQECDRSAMGACHFKQCHHK